MDGKEPEKKTNKASVRPQGNQTHQHLKTRKVRPQTTGKKRCHTTCSDLELARGRRNSEAQTSNEDVGRTWKPHVQKEGRKPKATDNHEDGGHLQVLQMHWLHFVATNRPSARRERGPWKKRRPRESPDRCEEDLRCVNEPKRRGTKDNWTNQERCR